MASTISHQPPPLEKEVEIPSRLAHWEELIALTYELGSGVSVAHWRRADCCDAFLTNGAIGWVLSGLVRKFRILENGHRRIVDVMMQGDFFGLRTDDTRFFSFEAASDEATTAKITRRDFNALAVTRPELCQLVLEGACRTIARLESHILVQGCTTSTQKIGGYLLSMARRLSTQEDAAVTLPLSRYDIADHVGIAVETVSRAITELRRKGIIELDSPRCLCLRCTPDLADEVPEKL
jgi:CRP-like cAMP-binding protein